MSERKEFFYACPVDKNGLHAPRYYMKGGCHHRRGKEVACGGCYARVVEALDAIEAGEDPQAVVAATFKAMRAEACPTPPAREETKL